MTNPALYQTTYDRKDTQIGVVHIGYGAFHRAHQAVYLDDYMQKTGDLRWGIAAVNLRQAESESFAQAAMNDDGYVLKTIASDGAVSYRLVRSHLAFFDAKQDSEAALELLADANVHVASMTVTESGYAFTDDWQLDLSDPTIAAELAGGPSTTIYAFLAGALAKRAALIDAPITLLCCDNIRNNGRVLENALRSYLIASSQEELADWVRNNVAFPCSMVDRITPRATEELTEEIADRFPKYAGRPIHAEDFTQWVLEENFAAEMPDLSQAGVQVVADVEPYEEAKIRILNGGHTGLAYFAALAGYQTFDQAMLDPDLRAYFDKWEKNEVLKGLGSNIPFNTNEYLEAVSARFENRGIADQIERICMDGYSKMAIYVRPTLRACLRKGIVPTAGFDCIASWVVYARKYERGETDIPYHEPFWDRLQPQLAIGREHALAADQHLWGDLPNQYTEFVPELVSAIQRMEEKWQA